LPQHIDRPDPKTAAAGQNFLYRSATKQLRALTDHELYKHLPVNQLVCRIYLPKEAPQEHASAVASALDSLLGGTSEEYVGDHYAPHAKRLKWELTLPTSAFRIPSCLLINTKIR